MDTFDEAVEFEWDEGNSEKNWVLHQVTRQEAEQVFFNRPFVVEDDLLHSDTEVRYYGLGHTDTDRLLFVVYTLRGEPPRVRVISARDMEPYERREYEDARAQELAADPEI